MRGRGSFSHIPHHVTTPRTYTYPNIRDVISSSYINVGTDENNVKETQKKELVSGISNTIVDAVERGGSQL